MAQVIGAALLFLLLFLLMAYVWFVAMFYLDPDLKEYRRQMKEELRHIRGRHGKR